MTMQCISVTPSWQKILKEVFILCTSNVWRGKHLKSARLVISRMAEQSKEKTPDIATVDCQHSTIVKDEPSIAKAWQSIVNITVKHWLCCLQLIFSQALFTDRHSIFTGWAFGKLLHLSKTGSTSIY